MLEQIAAQAGVGGVEITVFASANVAPDGAIGRQLAKYAKTNFVRSHILDKASMSILERIARSCDDVVFLSGKVALDPFFLRRALQLTSVSKKVVRPLVPNPQANSYYTLFSSGQIGRPFGERYPFRRLFGLNMVLPSELLIETGLLETRFKTTFNAAKEFAYRIFVSGCYFAPVSVPKLDEFRDGSNVADAELFVRLCPNSWDRDSSQEYEVPKVSIYIPAYNASKYIERAVESVLSQDMQDIDVCIANDGSEDDTLQLLEKLYSKEPRVRWVDLPNGGIGFASNNAIGLSRSLYIGQLDSDDCLKPGAVRRLSEFLDNNPSVVCAYGSCERIDMDGKFIKNEYRWPEFSREKMMVTSIVHHFRMFRRQAWNRTQRFCEDIVNAVDYDMFLKLSETGDFHHIDEIMYQRRWHGENTSNVNEHHQTKNTHRVQTDALDRLGLKRFWQVHVPNPDEPRRVTYRRRDGRPMVLFWPDYSNHNPYQKLLYHQARQEAEIISGDIDAALKMTEQLAEPSSVTFHLHWLNRLFRGVTDEAAARDAANAFLEKLEKFVWKGGRLVWTIHNTVSHDFAFANVEREFSARIAKIAQTLHLHSELSIPEVEADFPIPREKVVVSRHGNYIGFYPDYVSRDGARRELGLAEGDDVILFAGQVRPYKGIDQLLGAFRQILVNRPTAHLLIAGKHEYDPIAALDPPLTPAERDRITVYDRFIEDEELQLFFRSADMAVYPYKRILTSGSMMLALSFGVPVVVPDVGMTREVLAGSNAGVLYESTQGDQELSKAIWSIATQKDAGKLSMMIRDASAVAKAMHWTNNLFE